jgi:hypothetical protein
MKTRRLFAQTVGFALAAMVLTQSAVAQSPSLRAEIPFDFYLGDTLMPAGNYIAKTAENGAVVQISNGDGKSALAMTLPTYNPQLQTGRFVFHRYNNVYFLAEVHWPDYQTGRGFQPTKLELLAKNSGGPVRVAVGPK